MKSTLFALTAAIVLAGAAAAQAPIPLGSQFQVNTWTTASQGLPALFQTGDGGVVAVWYSDGSDDTPAPFQTIQAQRFAADGSPAGAQFQVNTYTAIRQNISAIGSDGAGGFVVAWQSLGSPGTDSVPGISYYSVQARHFDAGGSPTGDQFQVNTYTTRSQNAPGVSPDGAGGFIVVWSSNGSFGTDTSGSSIQAQRYHADGTPNGGEFQVNTYTTDYQGSQVVSPDGAGGFVVVWNTVDFTDGDSEIKAQRFAGGSPSGAEFKVNVDPTGFSPGLAVSPDGAGGFVVAWRNDTSIGPPPPPPLFSLGDPEEPAVKARRFGPDGSPVGDPFRVSTTDRPRIINPAISRDGAEGFVVVWQDALSDITPYLWNIRGRRFASDGAPLGDDFQINTYSTDDQRVPAVSPAGAGRFIVAWDSFGSVGTDSSYTSIQAQRYATPEVFADGFESGDTSGWPLASK